MRVRSLLCFVAVVAALRTFVACTHDVGPGDYCQDGWAADYDCPPGYSCVDTKGWTCQPTPDAG